jgi:hypothetical protein
MAESKKLLVLVFAAMVSSLEAYVFYAGGHDGWVVDPAESYNHWAERNRFQINDTIGTRISSPLHRRRNRLIRYTIRIVRVNTMN